jgi:hypothetical protein
MNWSPHCPAVGTHIDIYQDGECADTEGDSAPDSDRLNPPSGSQKGVQVERLEELAKEKVA